MNSIKNRSVSQTDKNIALKFFFFFYWRYNPLCVLAFSVILFHSVLSLLNFLHPLVPIDWISSSISSIHLFLGLPLILLPVGFHSNTLLDILFSSIRITCPRQVILLLLSYCVILLKLRDLKHTHTHTHTHNSVPFFSPDLSVPPYRYWFKSVFSFSATSETCDSQIFHGGEY